MIVVFSPDNALSEVEFTSLNIHYGGELIAYIGVLETAPPRGMRLSAFDLSATGLAAFEIFSGSQKVTDVVLRAGSFGKALEHVLPTVMASSLPRFMAFDDDRIQSYPFQREFSTASDKEAVFIYPGLMLPTVNGSRQRALSLFLEFVRCGWKVTIGDFSLSHTAEYVSFFRQFSADLRALGTKQSPLTDKIYKLLRLKPSAAEAKRFSVRTRLAKSRPYEEFLMEQCDTAKIVLFSHTWTMPKDVKRLTGAARCIVDCHDISYVRDAVGNGQDDQKAATQDRDAELDRFKAADTLIAISQGDLEELRLAGYAEKTQLLHPSFSWLSPIKTERSGALIFGFIGTNMIANRESIDLILDKIWPVILSQRPDAKLMVAGNICKYVAKTRKKTKGLIPLGIVPSLRHFYAAVDATLCPVVRQGGLNFKIVESLIAGRPVLANAVAKKSLPESTLVISIDDARSLKEAVHSFLTSTENSRNDMQLSQDEAYRVSKLFRSDFEQMFGRMLR